MLLDREATALTRRQSSWRVPAMRRPCGCVSTAPSRNTFFRLTSPTVIKRLREALPDLPDNPDPMTVFLKLKQVVRGAA